MFVIKLALERSEQKFVTKFNHVTPCLGSVLHVHAQWVTLSTVPGSAIGHSLKRCLLSNIKMLVSKLALEKIEQNFIPGTGIGVNHLA